MFDNLSAEETRIFMRMLRHGYGESRDATRALRTLWRASGRPTSNRAYVLLSARPGSLAGVRSDLVMLCNDLIDHLRQLEMQP